VSTSFWNRLRTTAKYISNGIDNIILKLTRGSLNEKITSRDTDIYIKKLDQLSFILLCNGKLVNAWGLGGLFNAHSKLVYALLR